MDRINTLGRRKTSIARVYINKGKGEFTVNGKKLEEYIPVAHLREQVEKPLRLTETMKEFDIKVNVKGGGIKGQSEAIMLGISRALVKINEEQYKPVLKKEKLLTRDPRMVERKKPGLRKARKRDQFSKR